MKRLKMKIKKMLEKDQGFTLVEIIVVLVILAILAAFTIPSMLGFVNDAKGKAYIAEAREVYVAAQATATEYIGTGQTMTQDVDSVDRCLLDSDFAGEYNDPNNTTDNPASRQMWQYLKNDLTFDATDCQTHGFTPDSGGRSEWLVEFNSATAKINKVTYVKNGYKVIINENNATVEKLK